MDATGLDAFDTTLAKTDRWLNDLVEEPGRGDRHSAYLAMRASLHALRDRLTVDEVAQLWALLGWLKHWGSGEDYTAWRPCRLLTALAGGNDAYLAPLLAAA